MNFEVEIRTPNPIDRLLIFFFNWSISSKIPNGLKDITHMPPIPEGYEPESLCITELIRWS